MTGHRLLRYLLVVGLVVAAAMASLVSSARLATADVTTFGYSNARLGDTHHFAISTLGASRLKLRWRVKVGGAVNGQPMIADGVRVGRRVENLIFVGTGHAKVVAVNANTGAIVWQRRVGRLNVARARDCGASPDGEFGVFASLAVDRTAGRVYAVDARGRAWAFRLGTGAVVRGWPVSLRRAAGDFYWGALTLSRGWLYVAVASLCDVGHYDGGIAAVDVHRPRHVKHWLSVPSRSGFGGGIWGWGGVSVDSRTGEVYAATGNSMGTAREDAGYGEAVVSLSPTLKVAQFSQPLAPPFMIGDRDFGTTPVLIDAAGCPGQLVAINKDGELLLYNRRRLAAGPVQRIAVAANSAQAPIPLYGMPAFDAATRTLVLVSPSTPPTPGLGPGVQALRLDGACRLQPRWWHPFDPPDAGSAPTIAGGVIYLGTGRNGYLRAYRLSDGRPLWSWGPAHAATLAAPVVDRRTLFAAGWNGDVWAFGPTTSGAHSDGR